MARSIFSCRNKISLCRRASLAALVALWALHAAADPIELNSKHVAFSEEEVQGPPTVGRLEFRGGLHLTSPDRRFGGWSGLIASADGAALIAISDNGYWLTATPIYDRAGHLDGVAKRGEIGVLQDPIGKPVRGARRDAEEIAMLPEGIAVAFEREHRVWIYPNRAAPFTVPPRVVEMPRGLSRAPSNEGIETMTGLGDGRLLIVTEGLFAAPGRLAGWISDGPPHRVWSPIAWETSGEFVPTGAATLPGGDVLILQRRFSWLGGLASRISRVAARELVPGATLAGAEIARLEVPVVHENFEGIAVAARGGDTLVYVISDDNYNAVLQRSLLLMFAFRP